MIVLYVLERFDDIGTGILQETSCQSFGRHGILLLRLSEEVLSLMKTIGMALLVMGLSSLVMAGPLSAPEINSASAAGAIALVSGALFVIRGQRKRS